MEKDNTIHLKTQKKPSYPITKSLRTYLMRYARERSLPISYARLKNYNESIPLYDDEGNDTYWETVTYSPEENQSLFHDLVQVYAILKTEGSYEMMEHLYIDRIDYCTFGNSNPFRIRIVNSLNDNQDYYYIKKADASRIYGLEMEHLLSPNRLYFLTHKETLVEEHIAGIPGDIFIQSWLENPHLKAIRLAKELVKFNERCFIRLLGDMRSYNFVVDLTPDFEDTQIRIRAMDFDQQSYSGRIKFYLPQYFKDNNILVTFCQRHITPKTAMQYQREEQAQIFRRIQSETVANKLKFLLQCMSDSELAPMENILLLRESLSEHYKDNIFINCKNMGEILEKSLNRLKENIYSPEKNIVLSISS